MTSPDLVGTAGGMRSRPAQLVELPVHGEALRQGENRVEFVMGGRGAVAVDPVVVTGVRALVRY